MTDRQQTYTEDEAISLLREHLRERGASTRMAEQAGVSTGYIAQWNTGNNLQSVRLPDSLLHAIGLRRVTYIERIPTDAN